MKYEETKYKKKVIYTDIQNIENDIDVLNKRTTFIKDNKIYVPINHNKKVFIFSDEATFNFNKVDGTYFKEWKINIGHLPITFLPYVQHSIVISNIPTGLIIDTVSHNCLFEQVNDTYNLIIGIVITEENSDGDIVTYDEIGFGGAIYPAYVNFGLIGTLYVSIYNPF